ncbi:MAG TPA: hypothetical protein VJQ56_01205, partial [Blastocatellia bacterium]|nr:hypothetical protein [Blastocatellia bacterium]
LYTASASIKTGRVWKEPLEDYYVTSEIINSPAFARELSDQTGLKPNQIRQGISAKAVEGGPRRARYPILVRITATTESQDQALALAQAAAEHTVARHEKIYQDAIRPHIERERRLEERLKDAWLQTATAGQSFASARDLALRVEAELSEVRANNTTAIFTEKSRLVEQQVAAGPAIRPAIWRPTALAALIAGLLAIAAVITLEYYKPARQKLAAGRQN